MKNEELQQLVFDSLGACSWEYDLPAERIIYSDEFFELLGYDADTQIIDREWVADNIHPGDLPQWRDAFVSSIKGYSKYFDCELRFRHRDGHYVWIQTRGVVTERDDQGRALRIVGMVFDISERETAKVNESRYRLFLDNSPDALSLKDREGRYLYINRRFEEWLDKPSYQIYGQTADEIFHSDTRTLDMLREHERRIWEQGETISMERQFPITDDKTFRHAVITKFPVFDESGQILAIGTTNTDVTERFRAREALQTSEQRYRRLFESAPVVLAESDWSAGKRVIDDLKKQGVQDIRQHLLDHPELLKRRSDIFRITNTNQEAVRIYKVESKKELMQTMDEDMPPEQRLSFIDDLVTFANGEKRSSVRTHVFRANGEEFPILRESELDTSDPEDWSRVLLTIRDTSAEEEIRMSEIRFRRLFESSPAALYESNWTNGKALVDWLVQSGVKDIRQHLLDNPQLIQRRDDVHTILNANDDAITMYLSSDKESHIRFVEGEISDDQRLALIDVLETFAAGKRRSQVRTTTVRENGEVFPIVRNCELISSKRDNWSLVLISIQDLSIEEEAARKLEAYQEELRSLAGKISLAEESERRRISSELHDGTIQNLVLARIHLANLRTTLSTEKGEQLTDSINDLLETSLRETRSLIFEISPPVLYELGLESAVEWLAEHYKQRTGVAVRITSDEHSTRLAEEMNIVVFQATRELLVNIAKHAQAKQVSINWRHNDDNVVLTVRDDGVGFDTESPRIKRATEGGFGLFAVKERLTLLGADIEIESSDQGTDVTITAPVDGGEKTQGVESV